MSFEFWRKWLLWANYATVGVGLMVAFAGNNFLLAAHNDATAQQFFHGHAIEGDLLLFKNWLFGVIGGTIVGFHVLMIYIIVNAFKKRERWAHQALSAGLLSWFFIDSGVSAFYGAVYNIYLINVVALLMIGIPLIATYKFFSSKA